MEASLQRMIALQRRLNEEAERLPIAKEIAADRSLDELKAEAFGAKHIVPALPTPPVNDAAKSYAEMVARLQVGGEET
jgi:hypothetical protein